VVLKVPAGGVRAKKIANANTSNVKIAKGIILPRLQRFSPSLRDPPHPTMEAIAGTVASFRHGIGVEGVGGLVGFQEAASGLGYQTGRCGK
jgi:uncharacterized protein YbjT (DUF2867 family)